MMKLVSMVLFLFVDALLSIGVIARQGIKLAPIFEKNSIIFPADDGSSLNQGFSDDGNSDADGFSGKRGSSGDFGCAAPGNQEAANCLHIRRQAVNDRADEKNLVLSSIFLRGCLSRHLDCYFDFPVIRRIVRVFSFAHGVNGNGIRQNTVCC